MSKDVHGDGVGLRYFEWMMDEYEGNIYICDMDTCELLYVNRRANETLQQSLGKTKEKFVGEKCYKVIQGRDEPCPFCTNKFLCEEKFYEWEYYNPLLRRTFLIKNRIIDWQGHRSRIELSHDMYSAEYKLAKKDRERENLIKTIPGGFCRLDARDFKTILWYAADFLKLIGYTAEQFETELNSECRYLDPGDYERVSRLTKEAQESGSRIVTEVRIITRSGETRILTITLAYVSAEESWDGIPSFYSMGIDVTEERAEQVRQQKAVEEAYQALRVANAAKTDFLSAMSHDIRTPMNAIVGMTDIARANLSRQERVRDCLDKINVSSRHLLSLINDVLDMSKIESGKMDLVPEKSDLSVLIQNVCDLCRPLAVDNRQDFQVKVGKIEHEKVFLDMDKMRQVLTNLLSNAVKYTPQGGTIVLSLRELPSLYPETACFEFVVRDNGIGMDEKFISKMFEPFSRAEDSRISKIQGTGLGMAIADNIVRMMNGTISVRSKPGEGTEFTVTLPLRIRAEETESNELAGLSVLIADDDPTVCEQAMALLAEMGIKGRYVLSGEEAIRASREAHEKGEDFSAYIVDWKMPGMDGIDTVRALRGSLGSGIPIFIISAYDYSSVQNEFLPAGADAFITKPLFKSKIFKAMYPFFAKESEEIAEKEKNGLEGKRVLLVEDNLLNMEIAVELLRMRNIETETAENGARAVEMFGSSPIDYYDAVLMDIQMPVMNGYDATEKIRALPRADAKTVSIIALTANAFVSAVSRALGCGMDDYILKPIDVKKLYSALSNAAAKRN